MSISTSQKDYLFALSIFAVALLVFWFSPVHQITDSNYSMLLSESLIKHHSFALDNYKIPRFSPRYHDNTYKNGEMYQLELVGPHLYYYFPPGSSVLSLPHVAVMNVTGISAANSDGTYSPDGEGIIETTLAAILIATLLAWSYFVRPTNVISIAAITTWVFWFHRSTFVKYAVAGALWFTVFVGYSWYNFHQVLTKYFLMNSLRFGYFAAA